jgi:hypothetical protein
VILDSHCHAWTTWPYWNASTYRQTLDILRVHCSGFASAAATEWVMGRTMQTLLESGRPVEA